MGALVKTLQFEFDFFVLYTHVELLIEEWDLVQHHVSLVCIIFLICNSKMRALWLIASCMSMASKDVHYVNNRKIFNGECARNFIVCANMDDFEDISRLPPLGGSFETPMKSAIHMLESSADVHFRIGSGSECNTCPGPYAGNASSPVVVKVDIKKGKGEFQNAVAWAMYASQRNRYAFNGCVRVTFNNKYCFLPDYKFCKVSRTTTFLLVQILVFTVATWLTSHYGGLGPTLVVISIIFAIGLTELVVASVACSCIDSGPIFLHEFGHVTCMVHPNEHVDFYQGSTYNPYSVMNSYVMEEANCMTPMDTMSLMNAVGQTPVYPHGTKICLQTGSSSIVRVIVLVILVGVGTTIAAVFLLKTCKGVDD